MTKREKRLQKIRRNPENLPYRLIITPDEDGFRDEIAELPGCVTYAERWEDIPAFAREAMASWIGSALKHGDPVPEPIPEKT